jgi:hypothetical protein
MVREMTAERAEEEVAKAMENLGGEEGSDTM